MAEAAKTAPKYEAPKELPYGAQTQKQAGRPKRTPEDQAEYFYNIRRTHILFFVSSMLLLVTLVWMFYDDAFTKRPWKHYQAAYQQLELGKLQNDILELERQASQLQARIAALDDAIASGEESLSDPERTFSATLDLLESDVDGRLKEEARASRWNVTRVPAASEAEERENAARKRVRVRIDALRLQPLKELKDRTMGEHYYKQQTMNFDKSEFMTRRYHFEQAEHHLREADPMRKDHARQLFAKAEAAWKEINAKTAASKADFDAVDWRLALQDDLLRRIQDAAVEDHVAARNKLRKELDDKIARFRREKPQLANTLRNAPMLDFFDPSIKVDQVLLDDIRDNYYFAKIGKVDRCHTCHKGINNPDYEVEINPTAQDEIDQYRFKNAFLRQYVDHATNRTPEAQCPICENGRGDPPKTIVQIPHGGWSNDDAIKYTKALMAHPRRDLYVAGSSPHALDKIGCTVCHDGDGRDTEFSRAVHMPGSAKEREDWKRRHHYHYRHLWDAPMLPQKYITASCRRCHREEVELKDSSEYGQGMLLYERLGCYACHRTDTYQVMPKDHADPAMDPNRKARRPGPPLTHVTDKFSTSWMRQWILNPKDFRLTTRMPRFFGQSNSRSIHVASDLAGQIGCGPEIPPQRLESVIAGSIADYLASTSQSRTYAALPPGQGDSARGLALFEQVGCRACHRTEDGEEHFPRRTNILNKGDDKRAPEGDSWYLKEFGPNLAAIGTKLGAGSPEDERGRRWLFNWLKNPEHYFAQTRMPMMRPLDKPGLDDAGVLNMVEYLMSLRKADGWDRDLPKPDGQADPGVLNYLVFEQLKLKMPEVDALVELDRMKKDPVAQQRWFGRKMVLNYGCYSCHELRPETAEDVARLNSRVENPIDWTNTEGIGVELTGNNPEGIKGVDRLDFGYTAVDEIGNENGVSFRHGYTGDEYHHLDPANKTTSKVGVHHFRHEWFFNKMLDPRVFDGGKLASKPPDELLRMPNFYLNAHEAELLTTFLMSLTDHDFPQGLVRDVKRRMTPDQIALNRGERLIRENNCRSCHRFQLDRFLVEYRREEMSGGRKKERTTNEWVEGRLLSEFPAAEASDVAKTWGITAYGTPRLFSYAWTADSRTLAPGAMPTDRGQFVLFDGRESWFIEGSLTELKARRPVKVHIPQEGGEIIPQIRAYKGAHATELAIDVKAEGEFENRIPPMLRTQGSKTQADWLFQFLKFPTPIRPALYKGRERSGEWVQFSKALDGVIDYEDEEFDTKKAVSAMRKLVDGLPAGPDRSKLSETVASLEGRAPSIKELETAIVALKAMLPGRPEIGIRMPTFGFSDEEASALVRYFWVRDQLPGQEPYPYTGFPERDEAYVATRKEIFEDVRKAVIEKDCTSCHMYQDRMPKDESVTKIGPDLANFEKRLRPRWLYAWMKNPAAIYPLTTMPAFNFDPYEPGDTKVTPEERLRAAEDRRRAAVEYLLNFHKQTGTR